MTWTTRLAALALLSLLPVLLIACPPELNPEPDDDDAALPVGDAFDIVVVIDNSNSMARIHEQLQAEFPALLEALNASGVDWRLGVTTTDIESLGGGNQGNLRASGPLGGMSCSYDLVTADQEPAEAEALFRDLVDVGVDGDTDEKGVYAAALALCKAGDADFWDGLDARPEDDPVKRICGLVPAAERECNGGALRPDTPTLVITISDEGDDTERLETLPGSTWLDACVQEHNDDPAYGECECRQQWWVDFFEGIGRPVIFVTVGPTYQLGNQWVPLCDGTEVQYPGPCNPFGNTICSVDFYQRIACLTGGRFFPVEVTAAVNEPATCDLTDFGALAEELAGLLTGG